MLTLPLLSNPNLPGIASNSTSPTRQSNIKSSKTSAKEVNVAPAPTETLSLSFFSAGWTSAPNSNSGQAKIVTNAKLPTPEGLTKSSTSIASGSMIGPCFLDISAPETRHEPNIDGFLAQFLPQASKDQGTLSSSDLNFAQGAQVVSSAQKFIIPVPTFANTGGGEDLVYPEGARNEKGESIAGQPVTNWEGKPIGGPGEKGVVFFNEKDQSYQAVKANGSGVVIMNQVTEGQGKALLNRIGDNPDQLSLKEFKAVLEWSYSELGIKDKYDSDRDFIKSKMNALETSSTGIPQYGLHRRDDRDVCEVVFVEGKGSFEGPAASPQLFENGAVILRQPDAKAEDGFIYRLIQPDAFQMTYRNKDGSAIALDRLPRHQN